MLHYNITGRTCLYLEHNFIRLRQPQLAITITVAIIVKCYFLRFSIRELQS